MRGWSLPDNDKTLENPSSNTGRPSHPKTPLDRNYSLPCKLQLVAAPLGENGGAGLPLRRCRRVEASTSPTARVMPGHREGRGVGNLEVGRQTNDIRQRLDRPDVIVRDSASLQPLGNLPDLPHFPTHFPPSLRAEGFFWKGSPQNRPTEMIFVCDLC